MTPADHSNGVEPSFQRPWIASVWELEDDNQDPSRLVGSAVLFDQEHLLTCRHVSRVPRKDGTEDQRRLTVRFPFTDAWRSAHPVSEVDDGGRLDIAVLRLESQVDVPPAIVNSVRVGRITGRWRAHGFPVDDTDAMKANRGRGYSVSGVVNGPIGNGGLDLRTTGRRPVTKGFSGTPLWSDTHDAVVAIIDTAKSEHPTAIPIAEAVEHLHRSKALRTIAERAVNFIDDGAWRAWNLRADPAYVAHFGPRARGVARDDQDGNLFRGRDDELTTITTWLARWQEDGRALIVTGSPGTGKSAILGRIVTTADPVLRLDVSDDGVVAPEGSITIAVHAAGKTVYDVADLIADATRAAEATQPHELGAAIAARGLNEDRPVTVLIDSVDEAQDPHRIMNEIIMPLQAAGEASGNPRALVGTRRADAAHRRLFKPGDERLHVLDLDDRSTSRESAVTAYVTAILRARQAAQDRSHQTAQDPTKRLDADALQPVAEQIARASRYNFLVASLVTEHHAQHGAPPAVTDAVGAPDEINLENALDAYLNFIPGVAGFSARELLEVLAFARTPGIPTTLWRIAILTLLRERLDNKPRMITVDDLKDFADSDGASYLLTAAHDGSGPVYRLYHQELIDTLLGAYPQ